MKYVNFPDLGLRPSSEFLISGELEGEPESLNGLNASQWAYARRSVPRVRVEWWYHAPTHLWFKVSRNTGSDDVIGVEHAGARPT